MYEYDEEVDQYNSEYWLKLGERQYRYLAEEQFNKGSFGLIEDVPYPLLEFLRKEELVEVVMDLKIREEQLAIEVKNLRKDIVCLKEMMEESLPHSKVIIIEEVTDEEAKNKIYEYMKKQKKAVKTTEIAEKLHLSLEVVLSSLAELKKEGKIGKVNQRDQG